MKMRYLYAFLSVLAIMVLASCSNRSDHAALDLYYKYADNENLTVAYLGDFSLCGCKIDALMIQVNHDNDWSQLVQEFGMHPRHDSLPEGPDGQKAVSVGVEINADFVAELGLDTITDLNQVDEDRFNLLTGIITDKIREIVNNFPVSDSTLPTDATIAGDGPVEFGDGKNTDMDEYLQTLAMAVANQLLNEVVMRNGTASGDQNELSEEDALFDFTKVNAYDYGHCGYVSVADESKRTIWLFFYDTQDECDNILTHINKDIIFELH